MTSNKDYDEQKMLREMLRGMKKMTANLRRHLEDLERLKKMVERKTAKKPTR